MRLGVLAGVRTLDEATLSAGDARPVRVGVAVCARLGAGLPLGGRMVATLRVELVVREGGRTGMFLRPVSWVYFEALVAVVVC